jgi:hypothetical protein
MNPYFVVSTRNLVRLTDLSLAYFSSGRWLEDKHVDNHCNKQNGKVAGKDVLMFVQVNDAGNSK